MPRFGRERRMVGWGGSALLATVAIGAWLWSGAAASPVSASISCSYGPTTYGSEVICRVSGPAGSRVAWGDGHTSALRGSAAGHVPRLVGEVPVALIGTDGSELASTAVTVVPDLNVVCTDGPAELPIYELLPAEGVNPWGYVFVDADGRRIEPGSAGYGDAALADRERVVVGTARRTSNCQPSSNALDELGGSVSWSVESEFYDPYVVPVRRIAPTSKGRWDGLQPGEMVVTIELGASQASERVDVFFSGCT